MYYSIQYHRQFFKLPHSIDSKVFKQKKRKQNEFTNQNIETERINAYH